MIKSKTGIHTGYTRGHHRKTLRQADLNYLHRSLQAEEKNRKPIWRCIKSRRQGNTDTASLKDRTSLHSKSKNKAEIINRQCQSIFTKKLEHTEMPSLQHQRYPTMNDLDAKEKGVDKLTHQLNNSIASGPDNLSNRVLQQCSKELSPSLTYIFRQPSPPENWQKMRGARTSPP